MSSFKKIPKPYIIAEIGVNHECSIKKAKKMILSAAKAGASAVKFQYYKAEKLHQKNLLHIGIWIKKKLLVNINYSKNTINLKMLIT